MAKITIIDGNDEIELSTAPKENIKAYMVKGEPGSDGTSPTASISKSGDITTITVTDKNGTTEADVLDGYNPTVTASKTNKVTTITINDINGTATTQIYDGIDLTGGVPTNGVIGFDSDEIIYTCDGTESGDYYLTYNSIDYYFTMPTVSEDDVLVFNTDTLTLTLDNTTITTSSSGTGTELTFEVNIPDGYEITTDPFGVIVNNAYSSSNSEVYSCNYVNNNAGGSSPTGSVTMFAGSTAPNGYLLCDGSAVSRATYSYLYDVIGTSYGTGDGSTTFNLPNLSGKVPVGYDSSDSDFDTLGETGGEKTHTLTVDEIPSHRHKIDSFGTNPTTNATGTWKSRSFAGANPGEAYSQYTGGGEAHNNMPPYIVMNYIIKY